MPDTQEHRVEEAEAEMGRTADELQERSEKLGEQIDDAKQTVKRAQDDEAVPTAAGDWEETEPEDSTGEDPSGFDDPESLDLDDEDLTDDPADDEV